MIMNEKQEQFVISIMCRDRVGLIYEITKALSELDGNIADVRQSVLCGYFTMILLASFPQNVKLRAIERKLAEVDSQSETAIDAVVEKVTTRTLDSASSTPENAYVLTAKGSDRIGFVATVASFCVRNNINILDLSTAVSDDDYVMILLIELDERVPISQVRRDLQVFIEETGVRVVLQHHDIFKAVNEINLPVFRNRTGYQP
jgi:glycine cleavage system transcriptional repressor